MKLSEAIRIGCKGTFQAYRNYLTEDKKACCACGAAVLGVGDGLYTLVGMTKAIEVHFPEINREVIPPKEVEGRREGYTLFGAIVTLNDHLKWTREQIADWVESIGY